MEPSGPVALSPLGGSDDLVASNRPIDGQLAGSAGADVSGSSHGRIGAGTISCSTLVSSMSLNDNKAGMEGLDKERINKIIYEASKGSKFYENERRKEATLNLRIQQQQSLAASITAAQLQFGFRQADQLLRDLEDRRDLSHTIVHVDMDAFYAAVEMRDDPSLRDKPMAVGSMSMLSTSNYLARRFGIRAAMPGFIARKLCPELVIVPLNFDKYIAVSETVKEILALYDPNFSAMSLDEAYLDLTEHLRERIQAPVSSRMFLLRTKDCSTACRCDLNMVLRPLLLQEVDLSQMQAAESEIDVNQLFSHCIETEHLKTCSVCGRPFPSFTLKVYGVSAKDAVLEMRNRIEQRTHLTASAGIAANTMLAKICSDKNKPNGQFQIEPIREHVQQFISALPVRKIPGIGKVTEKLLEALGVITCQDLHTQRAVLYRVFSPTSFHHFMNIALGIGSSVIERDAERKSISTEHTFGELAQPKDLLNKCQELCQLLSRDLKKDRFVGKTVTLKIKTVSFEVKTRAHTLSHYSSDEKAIFTAARHLLEIEIENVQPECLCLRLMGVRMSKLVSETNCSSSVASFFEKQRRNNSTGKNVACLSGKDTEDESRDVTAAASYLSSSVAALRDSCFPQQDYGGDDDDDTDFQECIDNIKVAEMPHENRARTGSKAVNNRATQPHQLSHDMEKQDTIVHFLCSKLNCPRLGESNCTCDQCMVRRSHATGSLGDINSENTAPSGNSSVCQASVIVCSVSRPSVDIDSVNKTSKGCVNSTLNLTQTVSKSSLSGVSDLNAALRCSDLSAVRSQISSANSSGQHNQLPASSSSCPGGGQRSQALGSQTPESSHSSGMIHCPVCGQQKYQWPLDQLNVHIDLCLSRSTVREILTDQQEDQQGPVPRKRTAQVTKSDKRVKTQHTLLSFFKP
ncbi:unnamed protein product [Candidula unifasciata]|uniref:DNA polymerase kappa n=1 Tax=Candidula unifasciata TaxID=100452 RepID=A0A8S3YWV2_9EUPU|nr:unnamed protein product [Candidula unifasciata]